MAARDAATPAGEDASVPGFCGLCAIGWRRHCAVANDPRTFAYGERHSALQRVVLGSGVVHEAKPDTSTPPSRPQCVVLWLKLDTQVRLFSIANGHSLRNVTDDDVRPVTGRRMAEMKRFRTTSIGRRDQLDICVDEISPRRRFHRVADSAAAALQNCQNLTNPPI